MDLLVTKVEIKITEILPLKFAMIMDGSTTGSDQYLAVFAILTDKNEEMKTPL